MAARFEQRVEERLSDPIRPVPANAADWRELARSLAEQGAITGLDIFYWARTAWRHAGDLEGDASASRAEDGVPRRAILLVAVVLAGMPLSALLLGLYFVAHRLRRARSPALILAMLTGALAVGSAAVYGVIRGAVAAETAPAPTFSLMLFGGAALFLAGAFGVRVRNWWRVFGGAVLVGSALGVLAWTYLRWGVTP